MSVLLDLLLRLAVDPQQAGTEDVVKAKEDVPVVVDEEQVVDVVGAPQFLSCRAAEQELRLGGAAAGQTVVLLGAVLVRLHVVPFLLLFLQVGELAALREQEVRNEVVDDLFDLKLVFLLDADLPFDVMDDEAGSILQDLAVVVGQGHVRGAGRRRGTFL